MLGGCKEVGFAPSLFYSWRKQFGKNTIFQEENESESKQVKGGGGQTG